MPKNTIKCEECGTKMFYAYVLTLGLKVGFIALITALKIKLKKEC